MKPSFKQYTALIGQIDLNQFSEETLTEMFGAFFGKKQEQPTKDEKLAKLTAERDKLRAAHDAKWRALKQGIEGSKERKVGTSTMMPSQRTSLAAQGRAAELDWVKA